MHECKTVTLRTRPLKNGMLSYYLDYYPGYRDKETMKVIRHESLGIYVYAAPAQPARTGLQRCYGRESGGCTLPPFRSDC